MNVEFLLDRATGCRVGRTTGVESEMELAYAGLATGRREDQRVAALQFAERADDAGVVGERVVGEDVLAEQGRREEGVHEPGGDEVDADRSELEREVGRERWQSHGEQRRDADADSRPPAAGPAHEQERAAGPQR